MERFSERIGKRLPKQVQIDAMDIELQTSLWNVISVHIFNPIISKEYSVLIKSIYYDLIHDIYYSFLKRDVFFLEQKSPHLAISEIRFFVESKDYLELYDFIEFLINTDKFIKPYQEPFIVELDKVLKRESSGYRLVNKRLTPITNELEISEIEKALEVTNFTSLRSVNIHLSEAIFKLSDRKNPDFRNSVKESISAVESICKIISNDNKAELGKALNILKKKIRIHEALVEGFKKIYGYTSNSDGIRHCLLEESSLDQEDALYMLVSCSAFINYLIVKASKAGISLR